MKLSPFLISSLALSGLILSGCGNRDSDVAETADRLPEAPPNPAAPPVPAPYVGQKNTTASGLQYEVLRVGTGARPKSWNQVLVHYHGTFPNGTVFDSSVQRGEPIDFPLNGVIPGWTEGVQLMQEGAKYRFYIPWLLAYGIEGRPPSIPPKQDLVFEIELIQVLR